MVNHNESDWAAVQRAIEAEKARAWSAVDPLEHPGKLQVHRSHSGPFPRLVAAAMLVLAVGGGLFFALRPRTEAITLELLPFFASAQEGSPSTDPSPRERELGRRLAGWMTLAQQDPVPDGKPFPSGWLLTSKPGWTQKNTHTGNRKTVLERFFRVSNDNQEV